ncbi:unnamed protein product [Cuscuta campestris]|uniref:Pentacotripeptide-repeat region of PRORP domain-containing protein n=1 Tax=Cuscuta campestris TaxID=132261 RepID=A0A484LJ72_9ASTE|nr:unnamed protein product [Cuscuta campestris]
MSRFLKPFTGKRVTNFTNLKPARANLDLKNYLKTNPTKAVLLFRELLRKKVSCIDSYSLLYVIKSCTQKSLFLEGKQFHAFVVKLGFEPIIFLQTSLTDMYSASANLRGARKVFDEIPSKNVVCWTSLVTAFAHNQKPNRAIEAFWQMLRSNVSADPIILTAVLTACADAGALDVGEQIHADILKKYRKGTDLPLETALLNMYAKCGDLSTAKTLFHGMRKKDVATWTSMILGLAFHGQAEEALRIFASMEEHNKSHRAEGITVPPNDVTFIGVLMACSHTGRVAEGKRYFRTMVKDYCIKPRVSHYGCMVDLLCRNGMVKEAYCFIMEMPIPPSAVIWRTLLGSCGIHGDAKLAAMAHGKLVEMGEALAGDHVMLSNICAAKGMWEEKARLRNDMRQRRIPGRSSIKTGLHIPL